jgi:hypothetical protein
MFPSSLFKKADSKDSSLSQDEEELTSSIFASIVTPNAKKTKKKDQNKQVPVKAHRRNLKGSNSSRNNSSKLVKVGTVVSRTFKTWPCSRKPGDPPVPENFRGMVTKIDPKTKKVHVLFENSQNMRFDVADVIPLIQKKQGSVDEKVPSYLKNIQMTKENDVSDLDSKNDEHTMDTATLSYSEDDEVQYIGTKEVPDITLVKVVPGDKPYVDKEDTSGNNNNTITLM